MPSHLAGRFAVVIGVAAVLLFVMTTFLPPTMQVLAAVLSLPIAATALASATTAPRRRVR